MMLISMMVVSLALPGVVVEQNIGEMIRALIEQGAITLDARVIESMEPCTFRDGGDCTSEVSNGSVPALRAAQDCRERVAVHNNDCRDDRLACARERERMRENCKAYEAGRLADVFVGSHAVRCSRTRLVAAIVCIPSSIRPTP